MLRYAELRLDASTIKELPDGSIKVVGQLTHPGVFDYRNADGSLRREYRPADEVFKKSALETFAGMAVTVNHPVMPNGARLVTAQTRKNVAIGHVGDNVREDGGHVVADIYVTDAAAIAKVRSRQLPHISCGYNVDFDPTPGTTPDGQRFDGVQRNIKGNHVALLPTGIAPRGGAACVLRLDSNGDELKSNVELEQAIAKIAVLEGELSKARTDAAELPKVQKQVADLTAEVARLGESAKPERLDALVDERAKVTASAKAAGVETAGKSNLQIKRAIVAKRTPALAARVDSMSEEAVDGCMAVYAEAPHPSMDVLGAKTPEAGAPAGDKEGVKPAPRTDAAPPVPKYADLFDKHLNASRNAWKAGGDMKGTN